MKPGQHDLLRAVEDEHWWYRTLHTQVLDALKRHARPGARVFDAGCGTGGLLARLGDFGARGCDASAQAVEHCRARGLRSVVLSRVETLPCDDASFDAVLSLDVLYHAGVDEMAALHEARRVLRPDGLLVLNLPAFECLRVDHDTAVDGVRRYRAREVRQLLSTSGFQLITLHYWNAWLFLPLLLRRRFGRAPAGDLVLPPRWLNALLATFARLDTCCCRVLRVPFGSSVFALARRDP